MVLFEIYMEDGGNGITFVHMLCMCVRGINFVSVSMILVRFKNCSDIVVFWWVFLITLTQGR